MRGVGDFAIPNDWKSKRDWQRIHESSPQRFVVSSPVDSHDPRHNDLRLPRATFLLDQPAPEIPTALINLDRPFHIIIAPADALETKTGREFFSIHAHIRDYDLIRRLGEL